MAQHIRTLMVSDFRKGLMIGSQAVQAVDQEFIEEVKHNPWNFVESIFDLNDPNLSEEQRAGYIVGYLTEVFTHTPIKSLM
ncbi:hypothetical protein KDW_18340 [Dictyobacter vulcani]|uniref:Uncharacterized protein n=1 Tax=Dictyobacter vulcani TaxID=2607529 RepID=A0A5J4KKU5_9CHLR|nr:hypothetical protein [Dictyobacter vulcani]GER87672.1 hypothetical protein KDW_18340 [Dictyobacter vulcani]